MSTVNQLKTITTNTQSKVEAQLSATGGLLRLAPNWVPRSFLQPGLRLKLHPDDTYAYGANRGGIDERWFASTTEAANEGRVPDEGLSYVVVGKERFPLRQAVADCGLAAAAGMRQRTTTMKQTDRTAVAERKIRICDSRHARGVLRGEVVHRHRNLTAGESVIAFLEEGVAHTWRRAAVVQLAVVFRRCNLGRLLLNSVNAHAHTIAS